MFGPQIHGMVSSLKRSCAHYPHKFKPGKLQTDASAPTGQEGSDENARFSPHFGHAFCMGKKRRVLWAVLLVAVVAAVVWLLMPSPEPVYQGKRLSYWLAGYDTGNYNLAHPKGPSPASLAEADEAIRQIGTNACPILLRMLQQPNSSLTVRLFDLVQKQNFFKIPFAPANLNWKALTAFGALGSRASNAVPGLVAIFEANPSPFPQQAVPAILGEIGPPAEEAIPVLLQGLAHTNWSVRNNAVYALGKIHAQPKLVVPALIKCLCDPEPFVRAEAASALGWFGADAQSAIPALLELQRKEALNPRPPAGKIRITSDGFGVGSLWHAAPSAPFDADVIGFTTRALNQIRSAGTAKADSQ
jgi:hypothetical protein